MSKPEVERQKSPNLGFWGRIGLESLWIFCKFFSILPYWFRYYVVEPAVFGALRLLRYRYRVVTENLRNSFPEKSLEELHAIRRGFYRTLAEIFVDTFSLAGLTDEKCRQVVVVKDLEKQMAAVEGRDWIALTAHLGCWEYCSFWGIIVPSQVVVAVYHPLRSRVFDELYKRLRSHANICPVPMAESLRFYLRNREKGIDGKNIVMGLIADQNPPRRPDSHWFRFLNRDTIFFDGGEKLALRCGLPVYCCWLRRVKPGYYEMDFDRIYDGEEEVAPHEITERYVRRLEQKIREYPDLWMGRTSGGNTSPRPIWPAWNANENRNSDPELERCRAFAPFPAFGARIGSRRGRRRRGRQRFDGRFARRARTRISRCGANRTGP